MSDHAVKHTVTVGERSLYVQLYVPLAFAALDATTLEHLRATIGDAARAIEVSRDVIAAAAAARGLCAWCGEARHDGAPCRATQER